MSETFLTRETYWIFEQRKMESRKMRSYDLREEISTWHNAKSIWTSKLRQQTFYVNLCLINLSDSLWSHWSPPFHLIFILKSDWFEPLENSTTTKVWFLIYHEEVWRSQTNKIIVFIIIFAEFQCHLKSI